MSTSYHHQAFLTRKRVSLLYLSQIVCVVAMFINVPQMLANIRLEEGYGKLGVALIGLSVHTAIAIACLLTSLAMWRMGSRLNKWLALFYFLLLLPALIMAFYW
jgi:hypothetical protein